MVSILPYNSTDLERAAETAIRDGMATEVPIDRLWSAENCPTSLLPFLAWALSVDDWDSDWPEAIKRAVIAGAAHIHRLKGTPGALHKMFRALDLGLRLSEWFEYGGEPYTFRVDAVVSTHGINEGEIKMIRSAIANTKNARSHLERLRVFLTSYADPKAGAGAVMGLAITVQPWLPKVPVIESRPVFGGAVHVAQTVTTGAV